MWKRNKHETDKRELGDEEAVQSNGVMKKGEYGSMWEMEERKWKKKINIGRAKT